MQTQFHLPWFSLQVSSFPSESSNQPCACCVLPDAKLTGCGKDPGMHFVFSPIQFLGICITWCRWPSSHHDRDQGSMLAFSSPFVWMAGPSLITTLALVFEWEVTSLLHLSPFFFSYFRYFLQFSFSILGLGWLFVSRLSAHGPPDLHPVAWLNPSMHILMLFPEQKRLIPAIPTPKFECLKVNFTDYSHFLIYHVFSFHVML